MLKRGAFLVFAAILFVNIVSAANSTLTSTDSSTLNNAYACLQNQINKKPSYTLQEAIFGVLALGDVRNLTQTIENERSTQNCWPKAGCKIKETAQVLLAYDRIGKNTDDLETWLLSKNSTSSDLAWYLEIDTENHVASTCTIQYDTGQASIAIDENMKLSGNAGSCFMISSSGYLLKVRDSCLTKSFDISCKNDFVSAMLYQKNKGDNVDCLDQSNVTCYVLGETHGSSSDGRTEEQITSSCFKSGSSCDYEGTLWAVLALQKVGVNTDIFVPYLIAQAEDYERYFSYAFLSAILGGRDDASYSRVIELRKQDQFWELQSSPYNKYYDTALGMLALGAGNVRDELQKTQEYLLGIQTREGCWNNNNIRDTAFLLYSGWRRSSVSQAGGGSGGTSLFCQEGGFSCERLTDCTSAGGTQKQGFECSGVSICCSIAVPKRTCVSQNGQICPAQTTCNGQTFEASDTQGCCLGTCTPTQATSSECENAAGICSSQCESGEVESTETCSSAGQICCMPKPVPSSNWWIYVLIILIILVILAIIFRHKIQMWWFSRQADLSSKQVSSRPTVPPAGTQRPAQAMPMRTNFRPLARPSPSSQQTQSPARKPQLNKEYEDTLKKLKEMSK